MWHCPFAAHQPHFRASPSCVERMKTESQGLGGGESLCVGTSQVMSPLQSLHFSSLKCDSQLSQGTQDLSWQAPQRSSDSITCDLQMARTPPSTPELCSILSKHFASFLLNRLSGGQPRFCFEQIVLTVGSLAFSRSHRCDYRQSCAYLSYLCGFIIVLIVLEIFFFWLGLEFWVFFKLAYANYT